MTSPYDSPDIEWHDPLPRNIPRQTYTPAIYALGISLFFWGFLTSWILGVTGFGLIVIGVAGWARELVWQSEHPSESIEGEHP
jgi:hypothetical protein